MFRRTKDWPAGRRRRSRLAIGLALVTVGLMSCAARPWYGTASRATLSQPVLSPGAERPLASGVRVRMDAEYAIADFVPRHGLYYAVGEVYAADRQVIFMQGCGKESKLTLTEPSGNVVLYCEMRVPVEGPEKRRVHLAMRVYQRTGPDVARMIATSEPVSYELRNSDRIHGDLQSLTPCADIVQDDGMVHVCKH